MSEGERDKWQARYAAGADHEAPPSPFVLEWIARLATGPALDVGCGTRRHALALARAGYAVTAIDISDSALAQADTRARSAGLEIRWVHADLDDFTPASDHYAVIVNCHILKRDLMARYVETLRPGGAVLVEQHLVTHRPAAGPSARYRLRPGELTGLLPGLRIIQYEELLAGAGAQAQCLARAVAVREPWMY